MIRILVTTLALSLLCVFWTENNCFAQINYTANDQVKPYEGPFGYGTNFGWYQNWTDEELANIAAGNSSLGVKGLGVNSLRPWLPEWFLEQWGYDIRVNTFHHYKNLGILNLTPFIGYPAEKNREADIEHCAGEPSPMFKNMYEPIWDGGKNGTPVNDENAYALYLYKTVKAYGFNVKFWEIFNEPDFDYVGMSSEPKDDPRSWWNVDPDPCHIGFGAPVQYYVRMLRISYEVIKTLDPDAYVSIAGLGYPSFLDAVLRNTDNPVDGGVNSEFPHRGGAYFDAMCYHAYPHIDGSMRDWNNAAGGFEYFRHSDAAVEGILDKKIEFEDVLLEYGYDGITYPKKEWIITESNLPRKAFGEYIGSDEVQRNFIIKTLVCLQEIGVRQYHIYSIGETADLHTAGNEFQLMGLFKNLNKTEKYQQKMTDLGVAYRTSATLLKGKKYDPEQTEELLLPVAVGGAAFKDAQGRYTYVLWAKTSQDMSEQASAKFTFPTSVYAGNLELRQWNFGITNSTGAVNSQNIQLTAAPVFLTETEMNTTTVTSTEELNSATLLKMKLSPNPFAQSSIFSFYLPEASQVDLTVHNMLGQQVAKLIEDQNYGKGRNKYTLNPKLETGIYLLELKRGDQRGWIKFIKN